MGCGRSKLVLFNKKSKAADKVDSKNKDDETKEASPSSDTKTPAKRTNVLGEDITCAKKRIANKIKPISGPLQPQMHRSSSQLDFFRMLDEKIASGQDYNSDDEEEDGNKKHKWMRSRLRLNSRGSADLHRTKIVVSPQNLT